MAFHDVRLHESRARAGGHSCTIDIDYDGKSIPVDIGFIVYNTWNYPNLVALFEHLGVETLESNMSFGVSMSDGAMEWSGRSLKTIFAQKKNLISPAFWKMLLDILKFNKIAQADLKADRLGMRSLREYLGDNRFSEGFIKNYLAPMGAAIWSTPHANILDFPAQNFISFFNNHKLIHARSERPKWRTVVGGSRSYVSKMIIPFEDRIRYESTIVDVRRHNGIVHVRDANGHEEAYDQVIFATHTDQTLAMLSDATPKERALLSAIKYRANTVYLHRDERLMPKDKNVWSSWNYIETPDAHQQKNGVCVSYYMNTLQGIDRACPVFVSLNPETPPRPELTFHVERFDHPQFDRAALEAQREIKSIQGRGNLWYCGAWCGYGFHEDGLAAGLMIAERLGARIPWRTYPDSQEEQLEAAE